MLEIIVGIFGLLGAEASAVTVYNAGSLAYNMNTWDGASLSSTVKRLHEQNTKHDMNGINPDIAWEFEGFEQPDVRVIYTPHN